MSYTNRLLDFIDGVHSAQVLLEFYGLREDTRLVSCGEDLLLREYDLSLWSGGIPAHTAVDPIRMTYAFEGYDPTSSFTSMGFATRAVPLGIFGTDEGNLQMILSGQYPPVAELTPQDLCFLHRKGYAPLARMDAAGEERRQEVRSFLESRRLVALSIATIRSIEMSRKEGWLDG